MITCIITAVATTTITTTTMQSIYRNRIATQSSNNCLRHYPIAIKMVSCIETSSPKTFWFYQVTPFKSNWSILDSHDESIRRHRRRHHHHSCDHGSERCTTLHPKSWMGSCTAKRVTFGVRALSCISCWLVRYHSLPKRKPRHYVWCKRGHTNSHRLAMHCCHPNHRHAVGTWWMLIQRNVHRQIRRWTIIGCRRRHPSIINRFKRTTHHHHHPFKTTKRRIPNDLVCGANGDATWSNLVKSKPKHQLKQWHRRSHLPLRHE